MAPFHISVELRAVSTRILLPVNRLLSTKVALNAIAALYQAIIEAFDGEQLQRHVALAPGYQWDALSNKNWGHTNDELVDRLFVKKGSDDVATAHQPDILAGLRAKAAYEWVDGLAYKLHTRGGVSRRGLAGEDDVAIRVELRPHAQARFVGLSAKHYRINCSHKGVHAIEAFGSGARRQPFEVAVGARYVTISTGADVDDDFAWICHDY